MWYISDIGEAHLLRQNGNFYELPVPPEDRHLLVRFQDRHTAKAFCDQQLAERRAYLKPVEVVDND